MIHSFFILFFLGQVVGVSSGEVKEVAARHFTFI